MRTAYLDSDVIIGLAKGDLPEREDEALLRLLEMRKEGLLSVVTSHVAKEELSRHALGLGVNRQNVIYMLLDDVPAAPEEFYLPSTFGSAVYGVSTYGGGTMVTDEVLSRLTAILPHEEDARHVFQAAHSGIDYFVTCDQRSILRYALEVEDVASVKPRSPSQLTGELTTRSS